MALGVMVVGVRASVGMTGYSDSVCKGDSYEDDHRTGDSGSGEADRDRWPKGVDYRGGCFSSDGYSGANGSGNDCRDDS